MSYISIDLESKHINFCERIAAARELAARRRNRPAKNGAPVDGPERSSIDVVGVCCECAAYLYLKPIKWNFFAETVDGLPDLADWIDVKGTYWSNGRLIVQGDDNPYWGYLLVRAHERVQQRYWIIGWVYGYQAKLPSYWPGPRKDRPAYYAPQPILYPPQSLYDEVRRLERTEL